MQSRQEMDKALFVSISLYFISALFLYAPYKYIINVDGISYISIAQKYASFNFIDAVNGFWSPMISWLLVPFLWLDIDPVLATKLINLCSGFLTLLICNKFLLKLDISGFSRNSALLTISFVLVNWAMYMLRVDLLFLLGTLTYLYVLLNENYLTNRFLAVLAGILGAIIYFAKSFGFPFFIAHFFIFNLIFFFRTKDSDIRAKCVKTFFSGMIAFALISGVWIYALSHKYHEFTVSKKGTNIISETIAQRGYLNGKTILNPPPNSTAISIWEDNSSTIGPNGLQRYFYDFAGAMKIQIKIIKKNMYMTIRALCIFSLFSCLVLSVAIYHFVKHWRNILYDNSFLLLITGLILTGGYIPIWVDNRYLWLDCIILILIGMKLFERYTESLMWRPILKNALISIFACSFLLIPSWVYIRDYNMQKWIYLLSGKLKHLGVAERVVSNIKWGDTLRLSFYNDWRYYGDIINKSELGSDDLINELEKNKIKYLLFWGSMNPSETKFLESYKDVSQGVLTYPETDGSTQPLRVFRLINE